MAKDVKKEVGLKTLNKVFSKDELMKQLSKHLAKDKPEGYRINMKCIDDLICFETGRVCIVSGVPQSGKSEIVDFFNFRLNQEYGWQSLYFSPENYPTGVYHIQKLLCKYRNERVQIRDMADQKYENDIEYITNNFYFLNYDVVNDIDTILAVAQTMIDDTEKNIKILTLDPYNRLENQFSGFNETQYISAFLDKLTRFAQQNDILVNLIAHPTKQKDGEKLTGYSICGSHNFFAKADYMYVVNIQSDEIVEFTTLKVKFKDLGCIGKCLLKYDWNSGNYYDAFSETNELLDTLKPVKDSEEKSNKEKVSEQVKICLKNREVIGNE